MALSAVDLLARLLIASALGALVGVEREAVSRGAGARTHALVALGAALFTVAGAYGFTDVAGSAATDPSRVAAQVATGVGFIGAGAILRHGTSVVGVTTAATVWVAAATGVTVAAGGIGAGLVATALAIALLVCLRAAKPVTQRLGRRRAVVEVEYARGHGTLGPLLRWLFELDGRLQELVIDDDDVAANGDGTRRVTLHVVLPRQAALERLVSQVETRPEVTLVRIGHGEAS
jgi:putative Mg2+ transporter-C (MgtC) family protein